MLIEQVLTIYLERPLKTLRFVSQRRKVPVNSRSRPSPGRQAIAGAVGAASVECQGAQVLGTAGASAVAAAQPYFVSTEFFSSVL